VEPVRPGGHGFAGGRDAELEIGHRPKIGKALSECQSGNGAMRLLAGAAVAVPAGRHRGGR
jgi:hypothetical protein